MKKILLPALLILAFSHTINAKKDLVKTANEIMEEGKTLYKIDLASWYGTDLFMEKFGEKKTQIGGYFSYLKDGMAKCVFYSNETSHKVLATFTFDSTYNLASAGISAEERPFTALEYELYEMRKNAKAEIKADTMFKIYKGSNLNLIPVVYKNERRVYIITAPNESHVVTLGNDYLISFNAELKIISKKKIHKSYIPISNDNGAEDITSMHSHLPETGDFITPTDICTIMEYEKAEKWKQHIVISKNYVSIWDCKTNSLLILTLDAWKKINKE